MTIPVNYITRTMSRYDHCFRARFIRVYAYVQVDVLVPATSVDGYLFMLFEFENIFRK